MIVRLKDIANGEADRARGCFNSMIVRLKDCLKKVVFKQSAGFNSMIVRLKAVTRISRLSLFVLFQFYDSPIKSRY